MGYNILLDFEVGSHVYTGTYDFWVYRQLKMWVTGYSGSG